MKNILWYGVESHCVKHITSVSMKE
jgi:hypothetical protein